MNDTIKLGSLDHLSGRSSVSIAALTGSASAIPLSNRCRESIVFGHSIQLLRTVSSMMTMRWWTAACVAASIRHARVSGRSILIRGAVTSAFRSPLQKSAIFYGEHRGIFWLLIPCDFSYVKYLQEVRKTLEIKYTCGIFSHPVIVKLTYFDIPEVHEVRVNWDDDAENDVDAVGSVSVLRYPYPFLGSYGPYRELRF